VDKSLRVTSEHIDGQFDRHHQDAVGDLFHLCSGPGLLLLGLALAGVVVASGEVLTKQAQRD
jgi:hypothetical protein